MLMKPFEDAGGVSVTIRLQAGMGKGYPDCSHLFYRKSAHNICIYSHPLTLPPTPKIVLHRIRVNRWESWPGVSIYFCIVLRASSWMEEKLGSVSPWRSLFDCSAVWLGKGWEISLALCCLTKWQIFLLAFFAPKRWKCDFPNPKLHVGRGP